uniref:Uncharacterized protein n=1 Tax=Timema tahoe TaxID=61484 RepID=A0A7R9III0_9NEOP|nr:unnamed protein product [Timema tahoe]
MTRVPPNMSDSSPPGNAVNTLPQKVGLSPVQPFTVLLAEVESSESPPSSKRRRVACSRCCLRSRFKT